MNNIIDNLLQNICLEESTIKKNSIFWVIIIIFMAILFLSGSYKNGVFFVFIFVSMILVLIRYILNKKKERIEELEYSKNLLLNDALLKVEIENGITNTRRKYMLTENFYIDYARKNIVKFDEIDNIKLKFSFSLVPIIDCCGLNQFISIRTKDNKKINILNWSFSHWYPEDGEIYDIFVNKIKKG